MRPSISRNATSCRSHIWDLFSNQSVRLLSFPPPAPAHHSPANLRTAHTEWGHLSRVPCSWRSPRPPPRLRPPFRRCRAQGSSQPARCARPRFWAVQWGRRRFALAVCRWQRQPSRSLSRAPTLRFFTPATPPPIGRIELICPLCTGVGARVRTTMVVPGSPKRLHKTWGCLSFARYLVQRFVVWSMACFLDPAAGRV
jgi:hypothetical protein